MCRSSARTIPLWARYISGCIRKCGGPSRIRKPFPPLYKPCSASPWNRMPKPSRRVPREKPASVLPPARSADTAIAQAISSAAHVDFRSDPRHPRRIPHRELRLLQISTTTRAHCPKLRHQRPKPRMRFTPRQVLQPARTTTTITTIITISREEMPTLPQRGRGPTLPRARARRTA